MVGEWFYVAPGETIAIFSASHDKFCKITYEDAAKADLNNKTTALWNAYDAERKKSTPDQTKVDAAFANLKPILIFRPFQTWTVSQNDERLLVLRVVFSSLTLTHAFTSHPDRWLRVFFSKLGPSWATLSVSTDVFPVLLHRFFSVNYHTCIHSPSPPFNVSHEQTDTTTCSCRTVRKLLCFMCLYTV